VVEFQGEQQIELNSIKNSDWETRKIEFFIIDRLKIVKNIMQISHILLLTQLLTQF
jgi:hypothetical protein